MSAPGIRFRWDQILVLAAVVVAADYIGFWWLTRDAPGAGAVQAAPAEPAVPDATVLDDEMSKAVRRTALQQGINPSTLPELPELWEQIAAASPRTADVDVQDREAVLAGFERHLRSQRVTSGGATARSGLGGQAGVGDRQAGHGGRGVFLQPSMERIDELQAFRLTKLARQHDVDPALVLPPDILREAAIATGDTRSDASRKLIEAYRGALLGLSSTAESAEQR